MKKQTKLTLMALLIVLVLGCVVGLVACDKTAEEVVSRYILPQAEQLLTEDFTLPKTIGSADKLVEVTWTSSNTNAIQIVDNGTDYTAKVTLQDQVTEVTLTISAGKASKTFNVRVDGFSVYTFSDNFTFPQRGTAVTESFDLQTEFTYLGKKATITWSVEDEASKEFLSVTDNNRCVVALPDDDITPVKIRATFSYNGETANVDYNFSVSPILEHRQIVNRYYSVTDYPLELSGYIVHVVDASASYGNATFYMIDDDFCSGYYIYRGKIDKEQVDKFVAGAHVTFTGDKTKNYNGLWENNSGGTATVDDKTPIDPLDHIYPMDADLISGVGSAIWHESTFVSLSGWKVSSVATKPDSPTYGVGTQGATNENLFTIERNGVSIVVRLSKYINRTEAQFNELLGLYDTIQVGQYVDVTGLLGCYDNLQIQPVTAADIKVVSQEGTCPDGDALKAAVTSVNSAVKTNFSTMITSDKEVTMPVTVGDVTVSYRVAGLKDASSATVAIANDGKFTIKPVDALRNYDIEVTYTVNNKSYYEFFKLPNKKLDDQGKVDYVKGLIEETVLEEVTKTGDVTLPSNNEFDDLTIVWSVKNGAPDWLEIFGDKLTINQLPTEETVLTLVGDISLNGKTAQVELTLQVAKGQTAVLFTPITEAKTGTYKFGMLRDEWLYATGEMDGYYLGTTTNYEEAADFVISGNDTDGYTITAKGKYLEIIPRTDGSKGVNVVFNATQTEGKVWKWNDTIKSFTMVTTSNNTDDPAKTDEYFLGTQSDKTYKTISATYISNASKNVIAVYGTGEAVAVNYTLEPITEAKTGTYKFGMLRDEWLYATGEMDGYYLGTTTNYEEAADFVISGNDTDGYTITAKGKYLEIIPRTDGKQGVNVVFNATQTEGKVWKWNDTIKSFTMVTTSNNTDDPAKTDEYFLGTQSDKTYKTISATYISNASKNVIAVYGQLVVDSGDVGGDEPVQHPDTCQSACPICGKCKNADCTEDVCKDKCTTDHKATSTVDPGDASVVATFDFGENGDAKHADGSGITDGESETFTDGDYTLTLEDCSKVYKNAFDEKGNSCLKLGTGKKTASFTFTVGDDVDYVKIYIGKYKYYGTVIVINGVRYDLTKNSDDGEYDVIVIDTTETKTITVSTLDVDEPTSTGFDGRAMVDKIEFLKKSA